jgi:hypothetical protein
MALNRYQTIKLIDNINTLVAMGIISIIVLDWIVIYEYYLIERKTLGKMQSYCNTAENYKLSERQIMNVVAWMESN